MQKYTRMSKEDRKSLILSVTVELARKAPYYRLSLRDVANASKCSTALVLYHYSTMRELHDAVVEHARRNEILRILGDAVSQQHPIAQQIPQTIRNAAIRELTH